MDGGDRRLACVETFIAVSHYAFLLQYYSLDISYFKSSMDVQLLNALWDRHWVNTLAASPLLMGQTLLASQITDIAKKIRLAESQTASSRGTSRYMHGSSDVKTGKLLARARSLFLATGAVYRDHEGAPPCRLQAKGSWSKPSRTRRHWLVNRHTA